MSKRALLMSGGLDSVAAWWVTGQPAWFHFPCATHAEEGERLALSALCAACPDFAKAGETIEFDWSPFRRPNEWEWARENLFVVVLWARGYEEVITGWHRDDSSQTPRGITSKNGAGLAIDTSRTRFKFLDPVGHLSRAELIQAALDAGASPDFLFASYSCVWASGKHCGECLNCTARHVAFLACGLEDQTNYAESPDPRMALAAHVGAPHYVKEYRRAFNIAESEYIILDGAPVDLAGHAQFEAHIEYPKIIEGIRAFPENGTVVRSVYVGPTHGRVVWAKHTDADVRLADLLPFLTDPGEPLAPVTGDITVYLDIVKGHVDRVEVF